MRTHTGEKPYQCTYCDAAFAQGNDLKAHIRRHTGERFQCDLCSESFLMGYLLTQHKRTVHGKIVCVLVYMKFIFIYIDCKKYIKSQSDGFIYIKRDFTRQKQI